MSTAFTLQQWLRAQAGPLVAVAFLLGMGFAVLYLSAVRRRSAMLRDRSDRSEETFLRALTGSGFDERIARLTYKYLQEHQNIAFPLEPEDDLDRDLGLDGDDVQETIRDLLEASGRVYLPGLLDRPLVTVEDLVRYVQASPRRGVAAA